MSTKEEKCTENLAFMTTPTIRAWLKKQRYIRDMSISKMMHEMLVEAYKADPENQPGEGQ